LIKLTGKNAVKGWKNILLTQKWLMNTKNFIIP